MTPEGVTYADAEGGSTLTKWTDLTPSLNELKIESEEDSDDESIQEQNVVASERPKRYKLEDYSGYMHHVQIPNTILEANIARRF
jgi:hypothetical protein